MYPSVQSRSGKRAAAFAFALFFSLLAAGCHHNNLTSGYAVGWVTLTDEPGDFASYIVTVDSVALVGLNNGTLTVLETPETVDFTKLKNVSELWGSASIPNDTYTTAIITIDYTSANISLIVNGVPQQATVVNSDGVAPTTISVSVALDPVNQAYSLPTYATTAGIRLALDFDLAASNRIDLTTSPATVHVAPYFTVATSASDQKPILVRGPLVNTSVALQSYSIYVRPFFDEVNTSGTLTMFNGTSTFNGSSVGCPADQTPPVYTINGTVYQGAAAITQLSTTSAGSTMTLASTSYHPTVTPSATAAVFCVNYMVGGSTLEDFYTFGVEGDVIARTGNTLTVRGPTLFLTPDQYVTFLTTDYQVLVGPSTIVTQDGAMSDAGLNYNSVSVGQHVTARGLCSLTTIAATVNPNVTTQNTCVSVNGVPTLDATGSSATNTGSVRLQSTQMFGSLVSSAAGSLTMNLTDINQYPASAYNFAGTGASAAAVPAAYVINTGSLAVPGDLAVGGPVWVDGIVSPFGSAPPDLNALAVEDEAAEPATLIVQYIASALNNATAFATFTGTGLSINLGNNLLQSAQFRIGAELVDLTTLPASPTFVAPTVPAYPLPIKVPTANLTAADLPPTFLPLYCEGNLANGTACFNTLQQFVTAMNTAFAAATPASVYTMTARGTYDRATNQFTASAFNVVLD